ncbi:Membrane protein involved in the export of O-antigen and teichoic acid [Chitinophaga jiangningensis]|uniref:Membrane protein involved in the export of O-antigen and teichoic acid n=1 Tax=Chitinophaga jiangningensis TaxID=1419482 RepID=A0A1M7HIG3_9BACT|nr:oligosaccharide flippase family protein [Chitinophaga jiangningensis]SHM28282.1 Membrane protein involved in the export of O-antigen and teichoic acid [Chitinophaga jiangningensis]
MNNLLTKNIIANYLGKIWSFVSVYIFIPIYIKMLGIESYAIINFYAVILAMLFFADAGLTATLNRELARSTDRSYTRNLLFTMERIYLFICIGIALTIGIFSNTIATHWLKSNSIPERDLTLCMVMIGVGIALQFYSTLYNGGLMGLQKQVLANGLQVTWSIFRFGVALLPLYFYPNLLVFFIWQMLINAIFLMLTRFELWKALKSDIPAVCDFSIMKGLWGFALGMMAMGIISALNTQLDKLLISKILSLEDFGYYSLATTFAQVPVIFTTPIALAVLPQMTKLTAEKNKGQLARVFHRFSFIITVFAVTIGCLLFLYSKELITLWTHNPTIADKVDIVAKILLIGGVFLAYQLMPYHLSIANGYNKVNVRIGLMVIILLVPSLIFLIQKWQLIGAGIPWMTINLIAFVLLGYLLLTKFLPGELQRWASMDILLPTLMTCVLIYTLYLATHMLPGGWLILVYCAVIGTVSLVANLILYNKLHPLSPLDFRRMIPVKEAQADVGNN